jgi:hypothetical protein
MNPTQLICKNCQKRLPKVGGVEIRIHRVDGKTAYYFCSEVCADLFLAGSF